MKSILTILIAVALPVFFYQKFKAPKLLNVQVEQIQNRFRFVSNTLKIAQPFNQGERELYEPMRKLRSWFSSLGSSVAIADFNGDGIFQEFCTINPKTNLLYVGTLTKKPQSEQAQPIPISFYGIQYQPEIMMPTSCLPWDLNSDGKQDILVGFFGRGPAGLIQTNEWNFEAIEIMENSGLGFMSVSMQIADLNGDGEEELVIGDLFPRAFDLLDHAADFTYLDMPSSLGHSMNGGENRILKKVTSDSILGFAFEEIAWTKDVDQSRGWTLALKATDLSNDLLPEIYFANTFGPDQLFYNISDQEKIQFQVQQGSFGLHSTRSGRVGWDTFKAGGVDALDFNRDGKQDLFVANLGGWFVPEGNFLFLNQNTDFDWKMGRAEFQNIARSVGLFGRGWPYDCRFADLDADGNFEVIQAYGLLGEDAKVLRAFHEQYWALPYFTRFHQTWPHLTPDTIGNHRPNFALYSSVEGYYHSIEDILKLEAQDCRAVAVGDFDNDRDLDFVLSCMDGSLRAYWNESLQKNPKIKIRLIHSDSNTGVIEGLQSPEAGEKYALNAEVSLDVKPHGLQVRQSSQFGGGHTGSGDSDFYFLTNSNKQKVTIRYLVDRVIQTLDLDLISGSYTVFLPKSKGIK